MTQKNKWIVGILLLFCGAWITFMVFDWVQNSKINKSIPDSSHQGLAHSSSLKTEIALRVAVWDMTENNPMHPQAEIWIRGVGSKFLKDSPFLAGKYSPGSLQKAYFYPESRDGREIIFHFAVTEDMNPNGSVQHSLWISFDDEEIKLYGTPIKAANEESELIFKRK